MSSRKTGDGFEHVYAAAQSWVERALCSDDSLFTPGKQIWSRQRLGELRERFLDRYDEWKGPSFFEKLDPLFSDAPPEVCQLMAEAVYVTYLIVWKGAIGRSQKQSRINQVLGLSPAPADIPDDLARGLEPGIAHPGAFFIANFGIHPGYIIEFVEQWKEKSRDEQAELLDEPWAFKDAALNVPFRSAVLRDSPFSPVAQREAMLHLVFPDVFEGIVSTDVKQQIAESGWFAEYVSGPDQDVDRRVGQIREGLEKELGRDFDFFDEDILELWNPDSDPWDVFIRRVREYVDSGRMEIEETRYKRRISEKLASAREGVLSGSINWADRLKRALPRGNPLDYRATSRFCEWVDFAPDEALQALQLIWSPANVSAIERIRAFSKAIPRSASSRPGTFAKLASVLLMALNLERYPPFSITNFDKVYERTQYPRPDEVVDEASLYEHALRFLDRFIWEASQRGLSISHRLDAQSIVWRFTDVLPNFSEEEPPAQPDPIPDPLDTTYGISEIIADGCFLDRATLESMLQGLRSKCNMILQGPPGTGKTWLAKKLAYALIGKKDDSKVRQLQFHPNLSYEDFVRGWRPQGDGKLGLVDGPFVELSEVARNDEQSAYVIVIEEINRGNPASIFGELLTLLEADKRACESALSLAHQLSGDEPFWIPPNLYVVGTMNLADRSLALVDLALRRRFAFFDLEPTLNETWRNWVNQQCEIPADFLTQISQRLGALNDQIVADHNLGRQFRIGHSFVVPKPGEAIAVPEKWFIHVVETEIAPLLGEYWFNDPDKVDEVKSQLLNGL